MGYTGGPMTEAMYYVLLALLEPSHGYRLMQAVGEVSNGRVKMGPGTLYGVLSRLEEDGLIRRLPDRITRRKTYELTPDGREALFSEYHRLQEMIRDMQRMRGRRSAMTGENRKPQPAPPLAHAPQSGARAGGRSGKLLRPAGAQGSAAAERGQLFGLLFGGGAPGDALPGRALPGPAGGQGGP